MQQAPGQSGKIASGDVIAACDRLSALFEHALVIEDKSHVVSADTVRTPLVRYMLAHLRLRLRVALEAGWPSDDPVHLVLLGSTNSGKSTVVNVCLGRAAAGMHVTARFSQHPEAYRPATLGDRWLEAYPSRFAGYLRYRDTHPPRQSDDDLAVHGYRPALAILDPASSAAPVLTRPATTSAIIWDAPDFSTEVAQAYLRTVLDMVALADVVVMTVTEESYADDRGCALLRLVSDAGVQLHVVANKLSKSRTLRADMKAKVDENWRGLSPALPGKLPALPATQWHPLPHVSGETPEQRLSNLLARREAGALRDALARETARGPALKRQALVGAVDFLERRLDAVVRLLTIEVDAVAAWEDTVRRIVRSEGLERYRSDYLHGQQYGEFNQTLIRVMELLEMPWIGPLVRHVRSVVRFPLQLASGLLQSLRGAHHAIAPRFPEQKVLTELLERCLAALKAEAQALAHTATHPAWTEVVHELDSLTWRTQLTTRFAEAYDIYREEIAAEVQRRATAIAQAIAQRPWLLNVLRSANLALDAATIALVVKSHGLDWSDAVVGPLLAGVRRALLQAGLETYLARQEEILKQTQFEAVQDLFSAHLIQPVGRLFTADVRSADLEAMSRDFACVKEAVRRIAQTETA